ncbi:MAG: hypothetical protein ACE5HC_15475 [Candidatus Binatia bacterium]
MAAKYHLGFISPRYSSSPHYAGFKALLPKDVQLDFAGLELAGGSLQELQNKKDIILSRTQELAQKRKWHGLIVSGAPTEVYNPGLMAGLRSSLNVPVTTAMKASIAALGAYGAKRVLLLTPFDEPLNKLIRDHLGHEGVEAHSPVDTLKHYTDALKLKPEEVYTLTKKAFSEAPNPEAIYFQGAVLDPLQIMDRLESDFSTTVVASNPAMLWYIVSRLGGRYQIPGYGKLLREWPKLPD